MQTAYINCTILDGSEQMKPIPQMTVVVEDGKIKSIGDDGQTPSGCQIINLEGRYLMPGLINLHIHLPSSGKPSKKQTDATKLVKLLTSTALSRKIAQTMCEGNAKMQLMSGVTTIRTVGGITNFDTKIRDRILAGKVDGPRILAANMAVSVVGGHMAGSLAYEPTSTEEACRDVELIMKDHPDLIKLMITGGVLDAKKKGEPGVLRMPPDYVKGCCSTAHKFGYPVAAHVESPEGVRVALENGVDTIEHGSVLDEHHVALFKEKKASLICTISPALPLALFDQSISNSSEVTQFNGKVVMDGIIAGAKTAIANGIPVGLGTDSGCPFITHYDMWRELVYFHKYVGVSNGFALYTATKRNAEIARLGDVTGSIEAGKSADFLITEGNPLEDLTALRTPYMIVACGKRFEHPKVKKYAEVENELDKWL
jgi:Imidazolonepropionase and related amidohydrolases